MKRILSQCYKELSQFKRDRLTVALAFILPFITLIIFGYAIRLEAKDIPLHIQDFDNTPLSRAYIERLFATNQFIPIAKGSQLSSSDPEEVVDRGLAKVAVVIPPDFSRKIKSEIPVEVQAIVDGSDVNNARVIQNSIRATTLYFLRSSKLQPNTNKVIPRIRLWFNPGRKESLYIVPGLLGIILWIYPSLLAALAMVSEKVQGTIIQVYASNLSATELLLGKGLAYLIIGILEMIFIVGSGMLLWRIGFAGDPILLLISTLIYLTDSVMFGLLIGSRAADRTSAIQAVALIGFLTAFLLSGFIYPLSNIPFPLSLISNIVPARYYLEISRDTFVRGTGWAGVWLFFIILIILGLFIFNAARYTLRRMQLPD
ncbi:MAG: ABC transporter permease [Hydrococcus sp. C42_A2020_068]|uniref:ABC transporter permease n=1 Tax=Pleurocapsa sp. PCC 7327 TaxID=118163 RepID=UPI00029FD250|nr:ABC transporter permease [Pleurocapsa sp. PCC 7327]AFY77031.1 ABC-type multidrug transport system, permease component [Pleurocapsa sp. PCC 7327]MBF2022419.1 ABC transporter permease [Hydrococcus sp. C42_A2020_068]